MQKGFSLILLLMGIVVMATVAGGVYYFGKIPSTLKPQPTPEPVFCTQDAKQCPDGSWVGREGPNCEFTPCPTLTDQVTPSVSQTNCSSDSDCGLNICQCMSVRKEFIKIKDKICTRECPGEPKCINNQCTLVNKNNNEGQFCGGIAGKACPSGYNCELEGDYPDAGGKCIKE